MAMFKKTEISKNVKIIKGNYHPIKDWIQDPKGYFLIRVIDGVIEVGFCKENNIVEVIIRGTTPQEIYFAVAENNEDFISRLDHAAYLGKELEKAYLALKHGLNYVQDEELDMKETS